MKNAVYNHKLRYFAIVLVCIFALMAAAGYGITALSYWKNVQGDQTSVISQKPVAPTEDYTKIVIENTKAIVRNSTDRLFYYETDYGFVRVDSLIAEEANGDSESGYNQYSYSLNTSGGNPRYVKDSDKSQILDTDDLGEILAVCIENGETFLLHNELIEEWDIEDEFATQYVHYTQEIPDERIITPAEYYAIFQAAKESEEEPEPQEPVMTDRELLLYYIDALSSDKGMDLPMAVASTIVMILLAIYVVASAGHFGDENIRLTSFDRCGLLLFIVILALIADIGITPAILAWQLYGYSKTWILIGFVAFGLVMSVLCIGWLVESIAVRIKARKFWQTTTVYYVFLYIKKPVLKLYHKGKDEFMTYKEEKNGIRQIMNETSEIVRGERDSVSAIGVQERYYPLVNSINAIAQGKSNAVSDKLNSDRMRTELITNVSHDIKTPLTSIISYVELLDKEEMPNEQSAEYVEVLKRQSLRLKNLLEDLIEASKASTGVLPVHKEELKLGVIVNQVLGEYDERLAARGLSVVTNIPEEEKKVLTDGRHLSRVIGNLLSNITKYSLEGTRVYIDVNYNDNVSNAAATITFKNTSSNQLNISSAELMERFVRGDESRRTDGSGLGLSIAASLMQLMDGGLDIAIDGDLFKATVIL